MSSIDLEVYNEISTEGPQEIEGCSNDVVSTNRCCNGKRNRGILPATMTTLNVVITAAVLTLFLWPRNHQDTQKFIVEDQSVMENDIYNNKEEKVMNQASISGEYSMPLVSYIQRKRCIGFSITEYTTHTNPPGLLH